MNPLTPDEFEKLLHRELRALPPRRAPRILEARVLAAIEHRAQIPWYHQSWAAWPAVARAIFLIVALSVAGAVIVGGFLLVQGIEASALLAELAQRLTFLTQCYHLVLWLGDLASQVLGSIPRLWLWGSAALFMALNATFFGLGAAAYRALYRQS